MKFFGIFNLYDNIGGNKNVALPGRNDPCLCGSGKKFKKCCIDKYKAGQTAVAVATPPLTIEQISDKISQDLTWANDMYREQAQHFVENATPQHGAENIFETVKFWNRFSAETEPVSKKPGAFSAALELFASDLSGVTLSQNELADRYGVSAGTISKRYKELIDFRGEAPVRAAGGTMSGSSVRDILDQALNSDSSEERVRLAKQALELESNSPDAYLILGQETANPGEAKSLFKKGIAAGENTRGDDFFRVKYSYAELCWYTGETDEAEKHLDEILELQPEDKLGARYLLSAVLLYKENLARAEQLLSAYNERSAAFEYDRVVLAYKQTGVSAKLKMLYRNAKQANGHIPDYLLGKKKIPSGIPEVYSPGSRNEAINYVVSHALLWSKLPDLIQWMKTQK